VSYSKVILTALMEQKASGFQRIITGNEPWFVFYYLGDSVWAAARTELPQHIKQKLTGRTAWFRSFGWLAEFTAFLMCQKGQHVTQRSSLMLLSPV
jgi:hypothetical protein